MIYLDKCFFGRCLHEDPGGIQCAFHRLLLHGDRCPVGHHHKGAGRVHWREHLRDFRRDAVRLRSLAARKDEVMMNRVSTAA
jgi:hypothetical protein